MMDILGCKVVGAIVWLAVLFYLEIPLASSTLKVPLREITEDFNDGNDLSEYPQMVKGTIFMPGNRPENVYISDITKEKIIHVQKDYYDVFILKSYTSKTAIMIVMSKDADDDQNRVHHCEEWSLINEEFIPPYVYLASTFNDERTGFNVTANFTIIHDMPNIEYRSCSGVVHDTDLESRSKRNTMKTYGNWCGRWSSPPWSNCCPSCENPTPCVAANCTPVIDTIDSACARMTFCRQCWQETPNNAIPHCDCVRDFVSDLRQARCQGLLPRACYSYRSIIYNFMSNRKCWGRMSIQVVETYQCGFKQTKCVGTACSIEPQMCFKKSLKVMNNFSCISYFTCEETYRRTG